MILTLKLCVKVLVRCFRSCYICGTLCLVVGQGFPTSLSGQEMKRAVTQELHTLSGYIQSKSGIALPDCSIALWRSQDSVLVSASVSDSVGYFRFDQLTSGDYYLQLACLGYEHKRVDVKLGNEGLSLPPIALKELSRELREVVIVAKRPRIKLSPQGEISYIVSADPQAKHLSLYQMLQRVPLVSLSASGVTIKGSLSPTYYINGVPAPSLNQNPTEALRIMRADQVSEIQLITKPGAKYDGDFAGGIINIITKQRLSSSLVASLGGTINTRNQYGSTATLAFQLGKVIAQGSLAYSKQRGYKERWGQERSNYNDTERYYFTQEKEREYDRNNALLSQMQLSWTPNKTSLVNASLNYTKLNTDGTGEQRHTMRRSNGQPNYGFHVSEHSNTQYETLNFSSSYQSKWGKKAQLLLMYQYTDMPKILDDNYLIDERFKYNKASQWLKQTTHNKEHTLQVDYSYSFTPKHKLNAGLKSIARINSSESESYSLPLGGTWTRDGNPYNLFEHRQGLVGLYAEYSLASKPWSLRLGVRQEWMSEKIAYPLQPTDNVRMKSDDRFLSLQTSYALTDQSLLSLSYRSNITRPSVRHLSPNRTPQDPSYVYYGNPQLKGEKHHTWLGEWLLSQELLQLNLGLSYRYSHNAIQADYGLMPEGGVYRTYSNTGHYKDLELSAYASYALGARVNVSLNANISYRSLEGELAGRLTTRSGWTGSLSPSVDIEFAKGYFLNIYGGYNFPSINLEGKGYNFYHCGASLAKSVINDRLSLSLSALDFLWAHKDYRSSYDTPSFSGQGSYQSYGVLIEFAVTYRFSTKDLSIKKTSKSIQNRDVAIFGDSTL